MEDNKQEIGVRYWVLSGQGEANATLAVFVEYISWRLMEAHGGSWRLMEAHGSWLLLVEADGG